MGFREQYIFWQIAYYLVTEKKYRIIKITEDQTELWLENSANKNSQLIRLLCYDLDWSNWLQRDMDYVVTKGERFRRQLRRRSLNVVNIYVSTYPPVDDYEFRLQRPITFQPSEKTSMSTIIFESSNYNDAVKNFNNKLGCNFSLNLKENYDETENAILKQATITTSVDRVRSESAIFSYGKPFFTYVFIIVQLLVFMMMELVGGSTNITTLLQFGAKYNPAIIAGEWWRFFAPIVIHIGFFHLFMNTLALYYLGTAVERIYGNARFLFIYIVAGFGGTLASFVFSPSISAGASGAIFGCFGALLYFGVTYPRLFFRTMGMNVLIVVGINLMLGFTVPMIDNAGHLGGLVGGFLATAIVHFPKKRRIVVQTGSVVIAIALAVALLQIGFSDKSLPTHESSVDLLAKSMIENEDYEGAYRMLTTYIDQSGTEMTEIHFTLAFAEFNLGKYDDAKERYLFILDQREDFPEAHYYISVIYLEENNFMLAIKHAERAVELRPENYNFQQLLKTITNYLQGFDKDTGSHHRRFQN